MATLKVSPVDLDQVKQAALIIRSALDQHYSIDEIANKVKLPPKKLKRVFKDVYGMGLYAYLRTKRMERAKGMLLEGFTLDEITVSLGYDNKSNFSKAFKQCYNETPAKWRSTKDQMMQ